MYQKEPDFQQLKKLWTLKMVVELGSLKRASVRAKVSLSAISQTITGLEKSLGRKLLVRTDRKLSPSQFCLDLLAQVEPAFQIFSEIESIQSCAINLPEISWLNFGVSDFMATALLPEMTKSLREKMPKLKLTLRVGKCHELVKLVKNNELCMAVIAHDEEFKGVITFDLFNERLGLYCSTEHSDATAKKLGVAVLNPATGTHPYYYSKFLKAISPNLRPTLTSDTIESLYAISASGTMAAVLPERYATRFPGVLREIRLPAHEKNATLGVFKVDMISQKGCDPAEDKFLLNEIKSVIK